MELLKRVNKKLITVVRKKITPLPKIQRQDDIYLVSYPKSGNTWLSFMLANTMIEYLGLNMEVNFFNIHFFVPDIHISRNIPEKLPFPPFRRIIKSHYKFNPYYPNVFLLVRNPFDVMVSYYHYRKGLNEFSGNLSSFIKDKRWGIKAWTDHTRGWLDKSYPSQRIHLVFYKKLKQTPKKELKEMFRLMGLDIKDEIIEKAIEKSSFENMKRIERETASYSQKKFDKFNFVRKGAVDSSRQILTNKDLELINDIAGDLIKKLGDNLC